MANISPEAQKLIDDADALRADRKARGWVRQDWLDMMRMVMDGMDQYEALQHIEQRVQSRNTKKENWYIEQHMKICESFLPKGKF
jgi:CheY-like chemotaxis protein